MEGIGKRYQPLCVWEKRRLWMAVTLQDIADYLNVSRMTVSRVLNEKPNDMITETTRRRVRETARRMGYTPDRAAQCLAMKRKKVSTAK
jgi:DNA-binding LacI/PurR family transcriptional regulator